MKARLYFNKSDKREVSKTLTQVGGDFYVEILDNSSVTNPVLKLQTSSGVLNANYIWLEDFHRYYYINDWTVSQGYILINCHVDVLMTYKTEIREIQCVVRRNELNDRCYAYQNDDKRKLSSYTCIRTLEFDSGFDMDINQFVMGVVGDVSN